MHKILWYVQALRFINFFLSLIAFLCHMAQCVLLNKYQEKAGIPDWLAAGHWQYLLWFITLGLSLVGGLSLCLSACYFNRPKKYTFDRRIGALAIIPLIVSLITAMSFDSLEPWTNGQVKIERSSSALLSSCALYDTTHDKFYPLLYQRCLLNDWTWILSIMLCIFWASLVAITMFALSKIKKEETAKNATTTTQQTRRAEEPKWGRYIPDRPASIYSVTTLGNRSGLITPTSIKYGSSFYYGDNSSVPSLPSPSDYYPPNKKGGQYDKSADDYNYDSKNYNYRNSYSKKDSYYRSSSPTTPMSNYYTSGEYNKSSPTSINTGTSIGNYFTSKEYKSSPTSATSPTSIGNYYTSKEYKSSPISASSPTSIGAYYTSKEYKSSPTTPKSTIGDYFTSSEYNSNNKSANATSHYHSINSRKQRSPSISSSTYYNSSTIAPSEYNYDHDLLRSSPTHYNSLPSDNEESSSTTTEEPIRTPLYHNFSNKSKESRFTLR